MRWLLGTGLLAAAACTGHLGDPPAPPAGQPASAACAGIHPGSSPIRRMTRFEYNNTVRDLLGDDTHPADAFVPEEEALGFNNQAAALGVTQLLAEQYMEASEGIAARAVKDLTKILPCEPKPNAEDDCAEQFIQGFGLRASRRPLNDDEAARLRKLYLWGRKEHDFKTGIELVIQALLQSPRFLYRVEFGMPDPTADDAVALDAYEIASRLSYLLWGSMPDAELFAAADADTLRDPEKIEAEARRMLDDPRARAAVANFHAQWLGLRAIDTLNKDPSVYPGYSDALRPLWKHETLAFLDDVVFDSAGDVKTMLTAPYSMMNAELAAFYGIKGGPAGEAFERVELDPSRRAGLLTHASLLAVNAKPNQSSPVHRGKFVRERLLCQILPPPPNDVAIQPPAVDPNATTRDKFSEHATNPACAGCHRLMDPIGFGFEHYDGIGAWRDHDHGLPVDATGAVLDTRDVDGPFDGALELAARLGESAEVRRCVALQWFRFGYGRAEHGDDRCSVDALERAFTASGDNVKELLVALTQTDAFRYRRKIVAGQ